MCPTPPLEAYAEEICAATKIVSAYCIENGLPHPSFDSQAPSVTLPSTAPPNVLRARLTIQTASLKIYQLATEPNEYLPYQAVHFQNLACIHWLCHFRILSFIPLHGSVPYADVAIIANVPEAQLKSVARMAMLSNFLREPVPNEVAHSATSALFVTNPGMLDWALYMAEQSAPGAMKLVEATEKWGATEQKNQTAFNLARNTDLPFFDYVAKSPDLSKKFSAYMRNVTSSEGSSLKHLVNGFDWAHLGDATVVDVGGSSCTSAIALATAFPALRIIVQELPDIVAGGAAKLAMEPESVRARITIQEHNFFTPQPARDADVYLLRMVLHEWRFAEAVTILRHLVQAIRLPASSPPAPGSPVVGPKSSGTPGAGGGTTGPGPASSPRLIIMEAILPMPGSVPAPEESLLRVRDLTMIQAFNSREREMGDWERLFAAVSREENASSPSSAPPGWLVLRRVNKPFGSVMSVMEVEWVVGDDHQASVGPMPMPMPGPSIKREPGIASPGRNSPARGMGMCMGMGMNMGMNMGMSMGMNMSMGVGVGMGVNGRGLPGMVNGSSGHAHSPSAAATKSTAS